MRELWVVVVAVAVFAGCGKKEERTLPLSNTLPEIPGNTNFGGLYPRVNNALLRSTPDLYGAIQEIKSWADARLPEFREGSCATVSVVHDSRFTLLFGEHTLGVTIPWMQIYIRDGTREEAPFVWQDASLFVSTVLHEYVHAGQRARQAKTVLSSADNCEDAHYALSSKQSTWQLGFDRLKDTMSLTTPFTPPQSLLLHHWSSPIEQARDEVEASITTVKWMRDNPDELNSMTVGAVNNWAYAVQYLNLMKWLSTSKCFSPDEQMFAFEKNIYETEVPAFAQALTKYEPEMREFLKSHGMPALPLALEAVATKARPDGRLGYKCDLKKARATLPGYLLEDGTRLWIKPIPIDGDWTDYNLIDNRWL